MLYVSVKRLVAVYHISLIGESRLDVLPWDVWPSFGQCLAKVRWFFTTAVCLFKLDFS